MYLDPLMPAILLSVFGVLLLGFVAKLLKQPTVIAYLIAGVVLGPFGLKVIAEGSTLGRLGALGVVLLLFFVGMEVSIDRLLGQWRVAVLGTLAQILLSVAFTWALGVALDWTLERSIVLGFVISLSSTAVILPLLQQFGETHTRAGNATIGVVVAQDLAVVPMLLLIGAMGDHGPKGAQLALQGGGAVVVLVFAAWIIRAKSVRLPFERILLDSKDLQVFSAFLICFGLAAATGALELSSAIGAFLAGLLVSKASATQWVHHSLEPFRVVFVALFFVSIGLLVDLKFIQEHWLVIGALVLGAYVVNTLINAVTLRFFGIPWRECWYIGALLAQIGEFSFVLAALGLQAGAITEHGYQLTICVIILSLLFSPLWVFAVKGVARPQLV